MAGISKIYIFNFSGNERVKQNQKKLKTIQNLLSLSGNHFSSNCNKHQTSFWFFRENLILSLPGNHCACPNSDPTSSSNILKTVRLNIVITGTLFKQYLISFVVNCRLIYFALVVLQLLMFKVCRIVRTSKIEFFSFAVLNGLSGCFIIAWYFNCYMVQ